MCAYCIENCSRSGWIKSMFLSQQRTWLLTLECIVSTLICDYWRSLQLWSGTMHVFVCLGISRPSTKTGPSTLGQVYMHKRNGKKKKKNHKGQQKNLWHWSIVLSSQQTFHIEINKSQKSLFPNYVLFWGGMSQWNIPSIKGSVIYNCSN